MSMLDHRGERRRRSKNEEEGEGRRREEGGRECWTSSVTMFSLVVQGCIYDGNASSH